MASRASKKKTAKKMGGPFLAAAVFCEAIMEDSNKSLSAIKISDGIQIWLPQEAPANVPSKEQPIPVTQHILVIFRSGDSPGKHALKLVVEGPSGNRKEAMSQDVELSKPPHGGLNLRTLANLGLTSSGLYWIDVFLDGKRYTRMPLNVSIQRLPAPPAPPAKGKG